MEEWVFVKKIFTSEQEAQKFAGIVQVTESRLTSKPGGPQFDVETELIASPEGWRIRWRKVFMGYKSGCGSCGSCSDHEPKAPREANKGKVIEFRPK